MTADKNVSNLAEQPEVSDRRSEIKDQKDVPLLTRRASQRTLTVLRALMVLKSLSVF